MGVLCLLSAFCLSAESVSGTMSICSSTAFDLWAGVALNVSTVQWHTVRH